ncbi:LysR family transcriptional regulator [Actinomycetospora cinnamomea]|uniref:DNA-binding transcriptional LysR family regulator n=1 Tax=Actinomycetospora cinnamomea TaxID=663609 RepID=A0A2U1FJ87_9PSEU|nr:LysR family transcriptional regulator [Actinomycetospora cinnamomea]PVZ12070.1 DNA-binding transcriptional LysR family regulator [Actinomycetospora cinnamomea]
MPTLRQLEYFVAVVDEGSFTRAADQLFVTQPGLSQQIATLEKELGGSLFSRLPRSVSLTPTGRALLPHARAAVTAAERGRAAARAVTGSEGGELRIACVHSVSLGLLPGVLRVWRAENPDVTVRLYEHRHGDALSAAVAAGQADVGVGPVPTGWRGRQRSLGHEEMVVLLPPNLGADDVMAPVGGEIALRRLEPVPWVQYAPDHALADVLVEACGREGFRPRVAVRTEQTAAAPLLTAAGIGPSLVPAAIVPPVFAGTIARPAPRVERELVAYTGAEPDALTNRFLGLVARTAVLLPDHVAAALAGPAVL